MFRTIRALASGESGTAPARRIRSGAFILGGPRMNGEPREEGGDVHILALPIGTELLEYEILEVLGHGGFGITYRARDTHLDEIVALKEYFPNDLATRVATEEVKAKSSEDSITFSQGLQSFLNEARLTARFGHPNIVKVRRFFEMNGTGYLVLDFEAGRALDRICANGPLPEAQVDAILRPLLDALRLVHARATLHRDIKPSNIIVRPDGSPVLIDFGAARDFRSRRSHSITAIGTLGYSPPEQLGVSGQQGPWTDLYALGGVAYRCVTGEPPPDSLRRLRRDPYVPAVEVARGSYRPALLQTIDWMLMLDESERPDSVEAVEKALSSAGGVPGSRAPMPPQAARATSSRRIALPLGAAAAGIALLVYAGLPSRNPAEVGIAEEPRSQIQAGEDQRIAEERRKAEEAARLAEQQRQQQEAARLAEERRKAEEAARLAEQQRQQQEAARLAEERRKAEEAARLAEQQRQQQEAARLVEERRKAEEAARLAEQQRQQQEAARLVEERRKAEEAARLAEQQRQQQEVARLVEERRKAEEAARLAEQQRQQEGARLTEERRKAEEAGRAAQERRRAEDDARLAEERRKMEEAVARLAEERRKIEQEAARLAEERRKAEEAARIAEQARSGREAEAERRAEGAGPVPDTARPGPAAGDGPRLTEEIRAGTPQLAAVPEASPPPTKPAIRLAPAPAERITRCPAGQMLNERGECVRRPLARRPAAPREDDLRQRSAPRPAVARPARREAEAPARGSRSGCFTFGGRSYCE